MTLSKPKLIDHDHILESILEIRFKPKENDTFLKLLMIFRTKYPDFQFKLVEIPEPLRKRDVNLKYQPKGRFYSDDYLIAIGDISISFNCTGAYKKWVNFFPFIKDNLEEVIKLDVIESIDRIGLRYINFFEGENNLEDILKSNFSMDIKSHEGLKSEQTNYRTVLSDEVGLFNIQISNKSIVENKPNQGILLDIDSFRDKDLPKPESSDLFGMINILHDRETDIFFSLINDNYLDSLNPKY